MISVLSVMVVTQNRRHSVLHRVIGHQSQLRSGHCCTCSASCEAHPPLVLVFPAIVLPITCNLNHGLQGFKGTSITHLNISILLSKNCTSAAVP